MASSSRLRHPGLTLGERLDRAFGLVLIFVLATFVMGSLTPFQGWTGACSTALATLSSTFALATAEANPRAILWGGRLGALAVLLAMFGAGTDTKELFAAAAILVTILLLAGSLAVLRAVVTEMEVGFRTILGAVSVYMSLGLLFAFLFVAIDRLGTSPFFAAPTQTGDFLFFSMTTLTTTGYGDLVPASQPGRLFANIEMLIGQIFLVTLIARLVSMWTPGESLRAGMFPPSRGADPPETDKYPG